MTDIKFAGQTLRPIPAHPGYYASKDGRIWSTHRVPVPRPLTAWPSRTCCDQMAVGIYSPDHTYARTRPDGTKGPSRKPRIKRVKCLVAAAWLPRPSPVHCNLIHKDGDRTNCAVRNLKWATQTEFKTFLRRRIKNDKVRNPSKSRKKA